MYDWISIQQFFLCGVESQCQQFVSSTHFSPNMLMHNRSKDAFSPHLLTITRPAYIHRSLIDGTPSFQHHLPTCVCSSLCSAALPPQRGMHRGPFDLSIFDNLDPSLFLCVFPPCPAEPIVIPPIDWTAVLAGLGQLNVEQWHLEQSSSNN